MFSRPVLLSRCACLLACLTACGARSADFYVAPDGNDAWTGTLAGPTPARTDGPFASLDRARDAVRMQRRQHPAEPITVNLRSGTYELSQPLQFDSRDAGTSALPVVWRAYRDERVTLSGGRSVRGFRPVTDQRALERLPGEARSHVRALELDSAGVTDLGEVATDGRRIELFYSGQPMTLARWPNNGFVRVGEVTGGKPIVSHGLRGDAIGKFTVSEDRLGRWATEPDVWLSGYWFWDWSDGRQRVQSIDPTTRTLELQPPHHHYGYRAGQRFYAFNLLAELDVPGEWYLDRQHRVLYFWPPEGEGDGAVLTRLPSLLTFENASWITVRGIQLEHTRGSAVTISGGEGIAIGGSRIRNVGQWGVAVEGGHHHAVRGCDIFQTGEGGISLRGGDRPSLTPSGHVADNNHIHHYARLVRTYRPAIRLDGVGHRASHHLIHDAPHNAIQLSGNDHLIEFNDIHHVCQETGDVGAFYMGRDWSMRGNVIRHNYFHELSGPGLHGAMAVYLDDAASGTTVFGNLFYRASRAAFIGGGRDNLIENNIFVECQPSVHVDARGLGWMRDTVAPGGIMYQRLAEMPYQSPPWSTRYPELVTLLEQNPAAPSGNRVVRNISFDGRWLDLERAASDGVAFESNLVDRDPGFVDPAHQNFQLRSDSPAWPLGFVRIPLDQIGLIRDAWRSPDATP